MTAGLASAALALGSVVVDIAGGGVLKAPTCPVSVPMVPRRSPLGHDGGSALRLGSSTCDNAARQHISTRSRDDSGAVPMTAFKLSRSYVTHPNRDSVENDAELTFETLVTIVAGVTSLPDQRRPLTQPRVTLGK